MDIAVIAATHGLLWTFQDENRMGINFPPRTYFNFRHVALPEISFDEKTLLIIIEPPT